MNNSKAIKMNLDSELERRLVNWSYYVLDDNGYPSKSTIADFGLPTTQIKKSKPPFSINKVEADETNGWVNIMGGQHPEYKIALCAFYLRPRGMRISDIAEQLNVSLRTFNQRLSDARNWLSGCLCMT